MQPQPGSSVRRVLGAFVCALLTLGGAAHAQRLEVAPWLPVEGRTTLTGAGFTAAAGVSLSFNEPKPTLSDGKPVPATVQTDQSGGFRLELRLSAPRLAVTARAGTQSASLVREPPALETVIDGTTVVAREGQRVVARYYLSGPVQSLERTLNGTRAVARTPSGAQETFTIEGGRVLERVTYPPSPALLATLESPRVLGKPTGDAVQFWRTRRDADPTNPFIALELGAAQQRAGDAAAQETWRGMLAVNAPFYVFTRLAARLEALRQPELATQALERSKREFARAGYDPGFAVSKDALRSWGDPLGVARRLITAQNPVRAGVWFDHLRATTPRFPGYGVVYNEYAAFLTAQNRESEAVDWRRFSAALDAETTYSLGDQAYTRLAALGAGGGLLLLLCYFALQFVLLLKYYPQQTRDLAAHGGRFGATTRAPLVRLRYSIIAYQTITEKLLGVLLLAGVVAGLGAWNYAQNATRFLETPALRQGTAGGADYYQALSTVPGPAGAYLTGLGAHFDGDLNRALEGYRNAPDIAGAVNNAGAILQTRGDAPGAQAQFTRALELDPSAVAPKLNLGNAVSSDRVAFHDTYRKGTPMLEVPGARALVEARFGRVEQEFVRMAENPWTYLTGVPLVPTDALPSGFLEGTRWVIAAVVLTLLVLALVWLFVPRVRTARTAPRSVLYHLFAILLPGTGLADEVWGILLLVPGAVIGAILFQHYLATGRLETLFASQPILGVGASPPWFDVDANVQWLIVALVAIYVVNFLGWLLETIAVSRRVRRQAAAKTTP
jgi:tetratricopeptide (TPR) repeat protein